jgi:hypothetical protein
MGYYAVQKGDSHSHHRVDHSGQSSLMQVGGAPTFAHQLIYCCGEQR